MEVHSKVSLYQQLATQLKAVPALGLTSVSIVYFCEGLQITMLFPFLGFMVIDFFKLPEDDYATAGYYAGVLGACFSFCQFLSSFIFGALSDRSVSSRRNERPSLLREEEGRDEMENDEAEAEEEVEAEGTPRRRIGYSNGSCTTTWKHLIKSAFTGQRSIILVTMLGSSVCAVLFGLSFSYIYCIVVRSIWGFINGSLVTSKSYLSRIVNGETQSFAYSVISVFWGCGQVLGPMIGGWLARPAVSYPALFGDVELFIKFPYLLPCLVSATSTFIGGIAAWVLMIEYDTDNTFNGNDGHNDEQVVALEPGQLSDTELEAIDVDTSISEGSVISHSAVEEVPPPKSDRPKNLISPTKQYLKDVVSALQNRTILLALVTYFLTAFVDIFQEELFPLWALITVDNGGLSFSSKQIGTTSMILGIFYVIQPFLFPLFTRTLGKLGSFKLGFFLMIFLVFTPQLRYMLVLFPDRQIPLWVAIVANIGVRSLAINLTFSAGSIIVNNCCPPEQIGRITGLSVSFAAVCLFSAPFLAGPVLSLSQAFIDSASLYFINLNIPFAVIALASVIALVLAFMLPKHIDVPWVERGLDDKRDLVIQEGFGDDSMTEAIDAVVEENSSIPFIQDEQWSSQNPNGATLVLLRQDNKLHE